MEGLASDGMHPVGGVQGIPEKRMADGSHMDPDLMGAPGFQFQPDMRKVLFAAKGFVVCDGGVSMDRVRDSFDGGAFFASDGRADGPGIRRRAEHQRFICAGDFPGVSSERKELLRSAHAWR